MRMIRRTFVATAVAATATLAATAAFAQGKEVKIGYALAVNSHYGAAANAWAEGVEKGTNGAYKFKQFPASALGGERELIEGLQLGTIDLAILSTGATLNFVPQTGVFDVPFLMRDLAHARKVLDGQIGQAMLAEFSKRGLVALAWGEQGFRHLTNSKRPVVSAADAKGLKIRTTENQVHITAFRQIGILPTPMAWPEVATALQQGTIDACRILAVEGDEVAAAGDVADTQTLKSLAQLPQAPGIAVDGLAKECFVFQCCTSCCLRQTVDVERLADTVDQVCDNRVGKRHADAQAGQTVGFGQGATDEDRKSVV